MSDKRKEIVLLGMVGDERADACLTACVFCNDSVSADGAEVVSPLADALGHFSSEVLFSGFMEKIIGLFFQDAGKHYTQAFLVEYQVLIEEPYVTITKMAVLEDDCIGAFVACASAYVKSKRDNVWKP